jgi:hypothetical protein
MPAQMRQQQVEQQLQGAQPAHCAKDLLAGGDFRGVPLARGSQQLHQQGIAHPQQRGQGKDAAQTVEHMQQRGQAKTPGSKWASTAAQSGHGHARRRHSQR